MEFDKAKGEKRGPYNLLISYRNDTSIGKNTEAETDL
jgi:hypothetical protein